MPDNHSLNLSLTSLLTESEEDLGSPKARDDVTDGDDVVGTENGRRGWIIVTPPRVAG